jgi:hypothetical protein
VQNVAGCTRRVASLASFKRPAPPACRSPVIVCRWSRLYVRFECRITDRRFKMQMCTDIFGISFDELRTNIAYTQSYYGGQMNYTVSCTHADTTSRRHSGHKCGHHEWRPGSVGRTRRVQRGLGATRSAGGVHGGDEEEVRPTGFTLRPCSCSSVTTHKCRLGAPPFGRRPLCRHVSRPAH